ncbi:MAG: glycosyltransferase [Micropruina sp.]|nr:MAG: glycosyltransferase [Micropruina sp.]
MAEPLRIAFVSLHTSPADKPGSGDAGGMNVVEWHQAEALAALGHRVDLITRRSQPAAPDELHVRPGITLRHLPAGPAAKLAKSEIDAHVEEFRDGLRTLGPYDVVHSHHWMSGMAALPVAKDWGVPHVQTFHSIAALPGSSLHEGEPPESPARVAGEAWLARTSDAVVAISAAEARTVVERCGGDPERVHIVSPGVDGELFRPLSADERPADGFCGVGGERWPRGYLLFAARLQPLKGPDLAIAALAEVPEEIRPHLVVAGDVSADFAAYRGELDRLVDELGLAADITFIGSQPREELAQLMRGARITLVPSHSETFGLIALESAASGTPVIASAAGGLREAVAHGETGQLMDSRQPEHWGMAITRLLTKKGLLARMGVVARIHSRRFDWSWTAQHLVSLYRALMTDAPTRVHAVTRSRAMMSAPGASLDDLLFGDRHVVFAHAHPDDETLATGALIAELVARGVRVSVVTATRGERGDVVPGPLSGLAGTDDLIAHRERELAGALAELGVSDHCYLGSPLARASGKAARRYHDSGMRWVTPTLAGPGADAGPHALTSADPAQAAADLAAYLRAVRPSTLISYDIDGGYGHPDHVAMHHISKAAASLAGVPFVEVVSLPRDGAAVPDDPAITWFDLPHRLAEVAAALRQHASQVSVDGAEVVHSGGQREPIQLRIGLRRS